MNINSFKFRFQCFHNYYTNKIIIFKAQPLRRALLILTAGSRGVDTVGVRAQSTYRKLTRGVDCFCQLRRPMQ